MSPISCTAKQLNLYRNSIGVQGSIIVGKTARRSQVDIRETAGKRWHHFAQDREQKECYIYFLRNKVGSEIFLFFYVVLICSLVA